MSVNGDQRLLELSTFLREIPLFGSLDEARRLEVAAQLEPVHVAAGGVLLRQGDTAEDGVFLVVSGRLRVSVSAGGIERVLHDLGRGSIVGEIALLSDRPRSATVRALRDSDLLMLRVSSFKSLIERDSALLGPVAGLLVDRLIAADRPQAPPSSGHTIAVVVAGTNERSAAAVAELLAAELGRASKVVRVDADVVVRHLGRGAAQRGPSDPGRGELTTWLHAMEQDNDHVIYEADPADTEWSRMCLSQSDVVLLAASVNDSPVLGPVEARALATGSHRCELALMQGERPAGTAAWLKDRPVADYHHLRAGQPRDVARLARMITGTGCGLVLGGGGARGLAHLGVMRALEEAGVPIDVVGGSSIGSVMGATYALGLNDEERVKRTTRLAQTRLALPTLPVMAFSSGRRVDRLLNEQFGTANIEDLPVRFFCISASLSRAEEIIHDRGSLALALRASLSIPGIFPPVYSDGDLLVDGGVLDYVPIDVMRARVGSGSVIAVDVSPEVEPLTAAAFPAGLSGWRLVVRQLNPFVATSSLPRVVDTLTRSMALSGVRDRRAKLNDDRVDLLLRPPIGGIRMMDFKSGVAFIDVGYHYAAEALSESNLPLRYTSSPRV